MKTKKMVSFLVLAVMVFSLIFSCPVAASNTEYPDYEMLFSVSASSDTYNFGRGVTVTPNGSIYAIWEKDSQNVLVGFSKDGTPNGVELTMPSSYCGNLVSTSSNIVLGHSYSSEIYFYKPGAAQVGTARLNGGNTRALYVDGNGNLYQISTIVPSSGTKRKTVIYKYSSSKINKIASGSTIHYDKMYTLNYKAPASDGNCYPTGFAVDSDNVAYIADCGASDGYSGSVNGIIKYNLTTGKATSLFFSSNKTSYLQWIRGVAIDAVGNVAVLSRNSNTIALFKPGSTTATLAGFKGWVDDISMDKSGHIYIASSGSESAGNYIGKFSLNNVRVTAITMPKTKSVKVGSSITLTAVIKPTNATNKLVTYSTSNQKIATVSASGKVKGIKAGKVTITATSKDGKLKAVCKITVKP